MAQYFFDLHDGEDIPDPTGRDCPTLEDARHHAVVATATLLMQNPAKFWSGEAWTMTVKDDLGLVLFTLRFEATQANVVARGQPAEAEVLPPLAFG